MTVQDVADFVYQAAADGASLVFTYVCNGMCNDKTVPKVSAFIAAGKTAKAMLDRGASREEVGQLVSESGKAKFWDKWPPQ